MLKKSTNSTLNRLIVPALLLLLLISVILAIFQNRQSYSISNFQSSNIDLQSMDQSNLESEKLRQEIRKLEIESNNLTRKWQNISEFATMVTMIGAIVGVFITIWKQLDENKKARDQRFEEGRRIIDKEFSSIVNNLGSDNQSLKVSAAVSIITFLQTEYDRFHFQVYLILLANLKVVDDLIANRLLIQVFEKAIRIILPKSNSFFSEFLFDLTYAKLQGANLSKLDMPNVDIAFAELSSVNLIDSKLFRVKGYLVNLSNSKLINTDLNEARLKKANLEKACLQGANLVSANLKETILKDALFRGAKLQSAHLEGADLRGAHFEGSNLNDTYFQGADISDDTLRSIKLASHWNKAHFDPETLKRLLELK